MSSTVCTQKMYRERRPTASKKRTMRACKWLSRKNSRINKRPATPSSKMLMGPSDHSAMDTQSVGRVARAATGMSAKAAHRAKTFGGQRLIQPMLLFGKEANVEIGGRHRALDQAEGRLPYKAARPAQQGAPAHSPRDVLLREDVQDNVQQDPAHQERQQIPRGPTEKITPEIRWRMGQTQQKAAGDLDDFADGPGRY